MLIKEKLPMKKIINTFKYGEKKVKRSLVFAILSGVVTLAFAVLALVLANMLCFFVAIVAGFVTISLIQTFMIAEGENPTVIKPISDVGANSSVHEELNSFDSSSVAKSKRSKTKNNKTKAEKTSAKSGKATENKQDTYPKVAAYSVETQVDSLLEDEELTDTKTKKHKKKKSKKEKTKKIKKFKNQSQEIEAEESQTTEFQGELDMADLLNQSATPVNNQVSYDEEDFEGNTINKKFKVITAATAESYTKKKIKKTLHKYKVIKDHRMVIVDRSDKYHIYQTPAYVWVEDNQFHILLIEEEPRLLMIPIFRISEISYLKKQPADVEKDYSLFKKSTILTESFRPYLPDYNQSNKTTDLTSYKNLYGISQGIYFTNNSAKNLFDLLGVDFYVEDKVTTSNKVNIYFKEAYKANIKLRDNILDANGYADSITKTLDDMAHSNISYAEFKDTLNLMTKNKLITDEYANHYMDVRNSLRG